MVRLWYNGLLLRYLAPSRLGTLVRALMRSPAQLVRHGLSGLALLLYFITNIPDRSPISSKSLHNFALFSIC